MTTLIAQRTPHDCMICCIAMATGMRYETVMLAGLDTKAFDPASGCRNEQKLLEELGFSNKYDNGESVGDFMSIHRDWSYTPEFFLRFAWGRPSILAVPSLNNENGWHAVYYSGRNLYDPSPKLTYTTFRQLKPDNIVLFREGTLRRVYSNK